MKQEKAYKLLALQEKISNSAAKELIDLGLVLHGGKRLEIARGLMPVNTIFKITKPKTDIIFEDENLLAINKPIGVSVEFIKTQHILLNRLDKDTSGIVLYAKNDEFLKVAKNEYKNEKVGKIYLAIVNKIISEPIVIDEPILTIKGKSAFSKISYSENAKRAYTSIEPLKIEGKKTLLKVQISTGRTHQIRVHLNSIGAGILGDIKYSKIISSRLMLHCARTKIFDYDIKTPMPNDFHKDFDMSGINLDFIF